MSTATARQTLPLWYPVEGMPDFEALRQDMRADVCVVGAGIAGLTTAYLLVREGKNVVVLEAGQVGDGESGRTTAHLASALDDGFTELERLFGGDGARHAAESHSIAIDRIESIVEKEGIDCDFARIDGYLFAPPGGDTAELHREFEAALRAGLNGVEILDRAPIRFDTGPCLRFPRQGQFHPMKYLAGLASAFQRRGGRLFTGSRVNDFASGPPTRTATVAGSAVEAGSLVVATNTPVNDRVTMHTKQAAYRSYVVALEIPPRTVPLALYWDTEDPYHYVRLQRLSKDRELLIVGGEDHKTGQAEDPPARFGKLEEWARERFPEAGAVVYHWSGQVLEPVDSLGFIGRNPGDTPDVYVATGDSGHGMTHGTIAGMLLTDLILGRPNPWENLYAPSRKSIRSTKEYLRENVNTAAHYFEWLSGGDVKSVEVLEAGEGAVVRRGLTKVAVYRDEQGGLHQLSAVCPHLGCFVHWNAAEKTWDCPCHGSRFNVDGRVLNGPSLGNLPAVKESD